MNEQSLEFIMSRLDSLISDTNNKSTILIGIDTFLSGMLVANYKIYYSIVLCQRFIFTISILGLIVSLYFAISVIVPILKSKGRAEFHDSVIFFESICQKKEIDLYELYCDEKYDYKLDLTQQIYELSSIASVKFKRLKMSIQFLFFMTIVPWVLLYITYVLGGK